MRREYSGILLVEDDKNLGLVLKDFLTLSGFEVTLATDGQKGLAAFNEGVFDLCIVDIMLPFRDGFALVHDIRKKDENIPVIFLTARKMDEDRIRGFRLGADDYVTKPFSTEELLLRIKAILKRTQKNFTGQEECKFEIGGFHFDYGNRLLSFQRGEFQLTQREAEVLQVLCIHRNKLVKRETLLKKIWGTDDYFAGRSLDVYITKLRKYLKEDAGVMLINIHGTGYKLETQSKE